MAGMYVLFEYSTVDYGIKNSKEFNRIILIDPEPTLPKQRLDEYKKAIITRLSDPRFIKFTQSETNFIVEYLYSKDTLFTFEVKIDKWSQAEYDAFRFFDGV